MTKFRSQTMRERGSGNFHRFSVFQNMLMRMQRARDSELRVVLCQGGGVVILNVTFA